MPIGIIFRE